ncbi:unnamed protein product, partial [Mesorhabditis belari]|uniref:Serine/threonine-protein phosphatase n=1 Tax=Mesorhabditis belari TaxID=2138241 RepID=A0AAF3EFT8_9BILA
MNTAYYEDSKMLNAIFPGNNAIESAQRSIPTYSIFGIDTHTAINQEDQQFLDELIDRLMRAPLTGRAEKSLIFPLSRIISSRNNSTAPLVNVFVTPNEIRRLTHLCIESFKAQPMLLRLNPAPRLHIFGDLHGQLRDLRTQINEIGLPIDQSDSLQYLFLGDYVDRGVQSVETFVLLAALKCRYPRAVYMLRGNHEDHNTAITYGFYDEIMSKYANTVNPSNKGKGERIWLHFVSIFNWMPVAALIGEKILAMHGGLSPHLTNLQQINQIPRPTLTPSYGLMCDLLWSDPEPLSDPTASWAMSSRGISFTFDERTVISFCHRHHIELIVRAHQINTEMLQHGHKWFGQNGRLVTLFSAPNYLNMGNAGGVLVVEPSTTTANAYRVRVH